MLMFVFVRLLKKSELIAYDRTCGYSIYYTCNLGRVLGGEIELLDLNFKAITLI